LALTQLLQEHPELSAAGWSIDALTGSLNGFLYEESRAALEEYADVLGATVQEGVSYVFNGRTVYPFRLSTVWRDVQVSMAATVPLAQLVERAA
jgi:hypothetical protein